MNPVGHGYGNSFKGIAAYLLHDHEADTSERVGWTETVNLATDDPEAAWRVMAATDLDRGRLKAEAGIKNTGRKTKGPVFHFSISWHEEQSEGLTPEEMKRAAYGALRYMKAEDRQVLMVAHTDTEEPHVHIVINRVSTEDGRMLNQFNDWKKLSRWAQKLEEEGGKIYCHNRVINNAARDRGEKVRGEKRPPRNVYEERKQAANQNVSEEIKAAQLRKNAVLAKKSHALQERHKKEAQKLEDGHKARLIAIAEKNKASIIKKQEAVRQAFQPKWTEQHHEHQAQMALFAKREKTLIGRMQNAYKALDIPGRVGKKHEGMEVSSLGGIFDAISTSGNRKEALKTQQKRDKKDLEKKQHQEEQRAADIQKSKQSQQLEKNRRRFVAERMQFILARDMDRAKIRAEWKQRNEERKEAWKGDGRTPAPSAEKKDSPHISAEKAAAMARAAQRLAALKDMNRGKSRSTDKDEGNEY